MQKKIAVLESKYGVIWMYSNIQGTPTKARG